MNAPKTKIRKLGLLLACLWMAGPAGATEKAAEQSVTLKSLPAAVQQTARAEAIGATIRGITKEVGEDGKPVYEVEMKINGLTKDIIIAADGTLLISEQQVAMAALSPAVRATILKNAAKRRITMVESVSKGGTLAYYEAHVRSGKTLSEIKVGPDGKLIP